MTEEIINVEELKRFLLELEKVIDCKNGTIETLKQENKALKDNNNHLQAIIDDGRAENKRFREENKELKTCIEMIKNTEGQAHIEGVRLAKENKELKEEIQKIREGKCTDCIQHLITKSHKKTLAKTNSYIKALEEIREILLLPDMPEVKEQTIITSTMLDEIVRANRENKLQKIKQTICEVLNLS